MNINSNLFWCIIGAIISLFTSLIFYIVGLKRNKLTYNIGTYFHFTNSNGKLNGIRLMYKSDVTESISASIITIKNIGNTTIEKQNFAPSHPLSIYTTEKFLIDQEEGFKFFSYNKSNDVHPIFNLNENGNCNHIIIDFDYISTKDTLSCYILHTGNISFGGVLKDGKIISFKKYIRIKKIQMLLFYLCCVVISLLCGLLIGMFTK